LVAVPEQPFDTFQFRLQTSVGRMVMLRDAARLLSQHRDAHRNVEPINPIKWRDH
jgi:hypothetical protein